MMRQAEAAARIGLEHFVLDAGWYGGCPGGDFETGVGNWEVIDRAKFPNGLEPLAEFVRGKGMGFGLWFEPERAHRDSAWARGHPDWFREHRHSAAGSPAYLHIDFGVAGGARGRHGPHQRRHRPAGPELGQVGLQHRPPALPGPGRPGRQGPDAPHAGTLRGARRADAGAPGRHHRGVRLRRAAHRPGHAAAGAHGLDLGPLAPERRSAASCSAAPDGRCRATC